MKGQKLQIREPGDVIDRNLPLSLDRPISVSRMTRTHSQLLMTSKVGPQFETSVIEVKFKAVHAFALEFDFPDLTIDETSMEESVEIMGEFGIDVDNLADYRVFTLTSSSGHAGRIVAGSAFYSIYDRESSPNPVGLLYDVERVTPPDTVYRLCSRHYLGDPVLTYE